MWVRDEYGKLICIRGACPLNSLVIDYESVNNNVRDGIRDGIRESLSGGGDTIRPAWQTKLDQISRDPGFVNEARNSGKNPLEVIRGEAFRVTGFETRREAYAAGGQALAKEWSLVKTAASRAYSSAVLSNIAIIAAGVAFLDPEVDRLLKDLTDRYRVKRGNVTPRK